MGRKYRQTHSTGTTGLPCDRGNTTTPGIPYITNSGDKRLDIRPERTSHTMVSTAQPTTQLPNIQIPDAEETTAYAVPKKFHDQTGHPQGILESTGTRRRPEIPTISTSQQTLPILVSSHGDDPIAPDLYTVVETHTELSHTVISGGDHKFSPGRFIIPSS